MASVYTAIIPSVVTFWIWLKFLTNVFIFLQNEGPTNRKSKWASDFTLMTEYNKLMIATG